MESEDTGILTDLMWCLHIFVEWAGSTNKGRSLDSRCALAIYRDMVANLPQAGVQQITALTCPMHCQVGGWWHYEATKQLYGDGIFFSSTKEQPLPSLLVLDPSIQLNAASQAEMKGLHLGLILAGHLSNRVWVWPKVDCDSKRFSHDGSVEVWTGTTDGNALFYGGPNNLKCIDLELTWNYCMEVSALLHFVFVSDPKLM